MQASLVETEGVCHKLTMFKRLGAAISRTFSRAGGKISRIEDIFGGLLGEGKLSKIRDYESYLQAGSRKVWALYKCCDYIALNCIDTPKQLQRIGGDGVPTKHAELDRLLSVPNEWETFGDMMYRWTFHMLLTGNAFIAKDQPNLNGDKPRGLYLLNPRKIRIVTDPIRGVVGYIYTTDRGHQIPYDPNEIIHFKFPHPDCEWWGLGKVESAEDLFNDAINRNMWQEKFWKNGASPSGILICKTQVADQTQWDAAKLKWQRDYGGSKNSGKTAWLTGEWTYEQLGLTAAEMENIESSRWSVEQICHQLGVPLSVLGIKEASNYATARIDDMRFRRDTIKPTLKFAAETFNSDLVQGFAPNLELIWIVAGLSDVAAVAEDMAPLFDRGIVSINEMRVAAGLPAKKDDPIFDQHFINAGLLPLELAGVADLGTTDQSARSIVQRFVTGSIDRARKL